MSNWQRYTKCKQVFLFLFVQFITFSGMNIVKERSLILNKQQIKISQKGNCIQKISAFDVLGTKSKDNPHIKGRQGRMHEAINISNYLTLDNQQAYIDLLNKLMPIFHVQHQFANRKLSSIAKHLNLTETQPNIKTAPQKTKIEICFSSKWRQIQETIFLLIKQYTTSNNKQKTRVTLLNKRGLILQTISNVQPSRCKFFIAKTIKKSYGKLTKLIVLPLAPQFLDLDFITTLQQNLANAKIMIVSWLNLQDIYFFKSKGNHHAQFYELALQNTPRYGIILQQNVLLYGNIKGQIQREDFHGILVSSAQIIKRENKVSLYFNWIPQFSSSQFFIRFFTFYYNFVATQALELQQENRINLRIITKIIRELNNKVPREDAKVEIIPSPTSLHQFSSGNSPKEAEMLHEKMGKSEKQFIEMKAVYKDSKKVKEKVKQYPIKSLQQLQINWGGIVQGEKTQFEQFLKKSAAKYMRKDIFQGMNLMRIQYQLMIKPIKIQFEVKQQEYL